MPADTTHPLDLWGALKFTAEEVAEIIEPDTDPWLRGPDGNVVDLTPVVASLPRTDDCECEGTGVFAPTSNGPTRNGVQRCDTCETHPSDFAAAQWLARRIGATVWYIPLTTRSYESEEN